MQEERRAEQRLEAEVRTLREMLKELPVGQRQYLFEASLTLRQRQVVHTQCTRDLFSESRWFLPDGTLLADRGDEPPVEGAVRRVRVHLVDPKARSALVAQRQPPPPPPPPPAAAPAKKVHHPEQAARRAPDPFRPPPPPAQAEGAEEGVEWAGGGQSCSHCRTLRQPDELQECTRCTLRLCTPALKTCGVDHRAHCEKTKLAHNLAGETGKDRTTVIPLSRQSEG